MSVFTNPEIVRNARIQLRPKRMISAAAICAVISLAIAYAYAKSADGLAGENGNGFLHIILIIQAVVLVIGGGIACLHAIQREKDQNTFDFQRLTRLTPFELTIGKLFGPPLMVFFVFACLLPAAIVGAVASGASWQFVLAAYLLLILGTLTYMAFALVISLFLQRGTATWAILLYLLVAYIAFQDRNEAVFSVGTVSPFFAIQLALQSTWNATQGARHFLMRNGAPITIPGPFEDRFFGIAVHHALVLFILFLTLIAWLVPAVARNIKCDPSNYEVYRPSQALGFLCYLDFILFAFFRWGLEMPLAAQSMLLIVNIALFFIFGFVLLRNR